MKQTMNGKIHKVEGSPKPHSYEISTQDGSTYFAHIGDIKANEDKLYDLQNKGELEPLAEGDEVEFEIEIETQLTKPKAMHVRKKQQ